MQPEIILRLEISDESSDKEYSHEQAYSLARQLKDLDIQKLSQSDTENTDGTKGSPLDIGALIIGLSASTLPNLIAFLQNWVGEKRKVVIQAPNGARVEFVSSKKLTEREIIALAKQLNSLPKK